MKRVLSEDIKQQNRIMVYDYIHKKPGQSVTRTEVGRKTGISGPTILKIFEHLEQRNLILGEGSLECQRPGRRSNIYRFNSDAAFSVGVAYDGKTLDITLINLNYGIVSRMSEQLETSFSNLIRSVLPEKQKSLTKEHSPILGAGISLPAIVNTEDQNIRYSVHPDSTSAINVRSLEAECAELEKALGYRIQLENDVNSAAVAEFRTRGLSEDEDFVYITLASGLGAGIILNGRLRRGSNFTCGEIGYMLTGLPESASVGGADFAEWEIYRHSLEHYGIDLRGDSALPLPAGLVTHIAEVLALLITNLTNSLDVSRFVLGGFVYEKIGQPLIDELNRILRPLSLRPLNLSGAQSESPASKGAAGLLMDAEIARLLAD